MNRIALLALTLALYGCPDGAAPSPDGGEGRISRRPPVPLVFTSKGASSVHAVKVAAGSNFFACALASDGQVHCWGTNHNGQLGRGTADAPGVEDPHWVDLGTYITVKDLTVGSAHACAILSNDTVKCWGANGDGQLGLGDTSDRGDQPNEMGEFLPALDFGPGLTARALSAGGDHTCAILSDDSVRCWGAASSGQLGTDERRNEPRPSARAARPVFPQGVVARSLSSGGSHSCASVEDGRLWCWGSNTYGQVGAGDDVDHYAPHLVELGTSAQGVTSSVRTVVAGGSHTCAIIETGSLRCWGRNFAGELGVGSTAEQFLAPQTVSLPASVKALTLKHGHTCALLEDDRLMCWGMARLMRFDHVIGKTSPYQVTNLAGKTPRSIAAGNDEACLVATDDTAFCLDDMQLYDFER